MRTVCLRVIVRRMSSVAARPWSIADTIRDSLILSVVNRVFFVRRNAPPRASRWKAINSTAVPREGSKWFAALVCLYRRRLLLPRNRYCANKYYGSSARVSRFRPLKRARGTKPQKYMCTLCKTVHMTLGYTLRHEHFFHRWILSVRSE